MKNPLGVRDLKKKKKGKKERKVNSDTVTDTYTEKPLCATAREPAEISPAAYSSRAS